MKTRKIEQRDLFGNIDNGVLNENRTKHTGRFPSFVSYGVPVGKKGTVKMVRSHKDKDIVNYHVSYEFGKSVTDASVTVWVLLLKIYSDNNMDGIMARKDDELDIYSKDFFRNEVGTFNMLELKERIYGKNVKNRRVISLIDAIRSIDVKVVNNGRHIASTSFIQGFRLSKDGKTLDVAFNAFMLYALSRQMRLININKYLSLSGSASRIYLVMQGWKRYDKKTGIGRYVKVPHGSLCSAMGLNIEDRRTIPRLKEDFEQAGINFVYHKFEKCWYYPNEPIEK